MTLVRGVSALWEDRAREAGMEQEKVASGRAGNSTEAGRAGTRGRYRGKGVRGVAGIPRPENLIIKLDSFLFLAVHVQ